MNRQREYKFEDGTKIIGVLTNDEIWTEERKHGCLVSMFLFRF